MLGLARGPFLDQIKVFPYPASQSTLTYKQRKGKAKLVEFVGFRCVGFPFGVYVIIIVIHPTMFWDRFDLECR